MVARANKSEWLTLKAAADYLGVSYQTALKWARAKVLKTKLTPTKRRMVRRSDMETLYR